MDLIRMGQVPLQNYSILGDGRVARHFAHYFNLLNIPFSQWSRKNPKPIAGNCLLVLVSDGAIESVIRENRETQGKLLIHFSGSLTTSLARGAHPLMSFGDDLYDLRTYESIPFVTEIPEPEFRAIFRFLKNPVFYLKPELKPLYHALCVLSGNFSAMLWKKAFKEFEGQLGLSHEVLLPYLKKISENLVSNPFALTPGPLLRKDEATISKNISALAEDPYQEIYRAFADATKVTI